MVYGKVASTLPGVLPEEQREAGRDDAGSPVVSSIDIPVFLKVGIVIRQTEEGLMRTHLIMNAHRLTTFSGIKAEVTNVKQAQSAVMTKAREAMDVDSF